MKSKEEIEQLANEYANGKSSSDVFKDAHKNDFIKGYTQCQQDMADEIKRQISYCQSELKESIRPYVIFGLNRLLNSLNKQD